jgi:apolipoprotein N-acyltransferase
MTSNKAAMGQLTIGEKLRVRINKSPKLTSFILGALLTLIFSPFELLPILFLVTPTLLYLLKQQQHKRGAFALGFAFGYGHYLFSLYWIAGALLTDVEKYWYLVPLAVFGIPIIGALYASAAIIIAWHFRHQMLLYPIAFAISWSFIEYLRSFYFIPFPFNLIGYSSIAVPQLAMLAKIIGTIGLSTLLLIICGLIYQIKDKRILLVNLMLLIISIGAGQILLQTATDTIPPIRLVQPNILDYEYNPYELYRVKYQMLRDLSLQDRQPEIKIIIWPENSFPLLLIPDKMRKSIAQEIIPEGGFLMSGTVRQELDGKANPQFYNSLVAMNDTGEIVYTYDKHLLAPFGEYIPYHHHLPTFIKPFVEATSVGEFNAGKGKQLLDLFGTKYLPSICFEGAFPQFFQATFPNTQGNILINVTNDMWFGQTIGPHQHLMAARFRAIESGLPMLRVANTGITAVITPTGKITHKLGINKAGFIDVGM